MAAGNATIGALRVTLGADTADLEKGLKSSQTALAAFAGAVAGGMAAITTRAIAFAEDVGKSLVKIVEDMGKLHDTSQKLGISVEQLSVLAYQANLADVSFEALAKGSVKLSKAMIASVADPTSEAAKAFKELGISTQFVQANMNNQQAVIAAVAEAYSNLQDGAGKTANATKLFGKAGADLIPMLNEGKQALQESADEARQFGVVVSSAGAAAADQLSDNMSKLGQATKGIFVQALEAVLPSMARFSDQLVEAKKNSGFLEVASTALAAALKVLMTGVIAANAVFDRFLTSLQTLGTALAFAATGGFSKALDAIKKGLADNAETAKKAGQQIADMWTGTDKANADAAATERAAEAKDKLTLKTVAAKNAIDTFLDSQQKHLSAMNAEVMTLGMAAGEREKAKVVLEAYTAASNAGLTMTQAQIDKANQLAEAIAHQKMVLEGYQTTQANLTPSEKLVQVQDDLNQKLAAGAISADTFGRAMAKAMVESQQQVTEALAGFAGGFNQLFTQLGKKNKELATMAKAFAIVEATVNTYVAFTKALASTAPPFNYILAAGVLAAGLAKVIAIQSQTIPSAAVGFSGIVPGGFGGGDSKLFQAMVEPGEQVDITPGTDVRGGRGGSTVVELRGLGDKRYSLDEVKEIMRGIGDAMGFGYKFQSA